MRNEEEVAVGQGVDVMAKRLYRSKRECIIGGVAGGLAEYFDVDPTIMRILWVLVAFANGIGVLAYIVAWIVVPANPRWQSGERFERTESIRNEVLDKAREVEARLKGEVAHLGQEETPRAPGSERSPESSAKVVGIVLVCIGLLFLARNFWSWIDFGTLWPVILVVAGVALLASGFARHR